MISIDFFEDPYLAPKLLKSSRIMSCEILGVETYCISKQTFINLLQPILKIYRPYNSMDASAIYAGGSPEDDGVKIWEAIQNDFGIFNWQHENELESLFEYLFGIHSDYLLNPVVRHDHEMGDDNNEFEYDYWENFKEELKFKNRFFPVSSIDQKQLKGIFQLRKTIIKKGDLFYRVRSQGHFQPLNMGKPPPQSIVRPGRANPIGISYLYLGNSHEVCRIEARAGTSNYTIGTFVIRENLRVVDLSSHYIVSPFLLKKKLLSYISSISIIKMYVDEMSRPADPEAPYLDYLPTQYLCEFIKKLGYDGILFKSSQTSTASDKNLTLFESSKVECINSEFRS